MSEQKLLKHKEFINKSTCKSIKPVGSRPFVEEICHKYPNLHMASLHVDSLFTNIPLDGTTIDIVLKTCARVTRIPIKFMSLIFVIYLA